MSAAYPHRLNEARGFNWTRPDLDAVFGEHYTVQEIHHSGAGLEVWLRPGGNVIVLGNSATNATHIAAALDPIAGHPRDELVRDLALQIANKERAGGHDKSGPRYAALGYMAPPYDFDAVAGLDLELVAGAYRLNDGAWTLNLWLDSVEIPIKRGGTWVDAHDFVNAWLIAELADEFEAIMEDAWGPNLTFEGLVLSQPPAC